MKVKELIQLLGECDPEDEVRYAVPTHDGRRTMAVEAGFVEVYPVSRSDYYDADVLDDSDADNRTVVLLYQ
jgi:hypothetical protein